MAIDKNGVSVPAQSKDLDTTRVTTTYGLVHRQVITLADPETPTSYVTLTGTSLNVNVSNASLAATQSGTWNITNISGTVSLPTGASTATLQTTGNTSLNSIDTKTPSLSSGRVPVESNLVQALTDSQLRASAVPISFTRLASGTDSVSAVQSGTWNITNISGTVSLPTGAATSALQTTGNSSLSSIDGKITAVNTGAVVVSSSALPTGAATQTTLASIDAKFSALGQNTMAGSTPVVLASNHSDIYVKDKSSSYANITTTGTTTIKSGAGILRRLVINTKGSASNTFTIYDSLTGSGTVIATIDTVNSVSSYFEYGLAFTALTIVSATGTSANATVIYE